MLRVVVGSAELDGLPDSSIVLSTSGVAWTKTNPTGAWPWSSWGRVNKMSAELADGRPLLVLWNPASPVVVADTLALAANKVHAGLVDSLEELIAAPGCRIVEQLLRDEQALDPELAGLAALDWVVCWSRRAGTPA